MFLCRYAARRRSICRQIYSIANINYSELQRMYHFVYIYHYFTSKCPVRVCAL